MSALALKTYNRQKPPADAAALMRYIDSELRKLQEVVASQAAAILQLQAKVNP